MRTEPALRNGFLHVCGLLLNSSHRLAHLGIVQLRKLEIALPLLRSLNLGWKSACGNDHHRWMAFTHTILTLKGLIRERL